MHVKGGQPSTCRDRAPQMIAIIITVTFVKADCQHFGFPQACLEQWAGALTTCARGLL